MNINYLNATARAAWFCPGCHRYHAPHCDSCPSPMQIGQPNTLPGYLPTPWQQPGTAADPNHWQWSRGVGIGTAAIGGLAGAAH